MLLHPEIKNLTQALQLDPVTTTVKETENSISGYTHQGRYFSFCYGHDSLDLHRKDLRGKILDVDSSKLRVHSIKPGAVEITKDGIKSWLLYLLDTVTDVFESRGSDIQMAESLQALEQLYAKQIDEGAFQLQTGLRLAKINEDTFAITYLFEKMRTLQEMTLWTDVVGAFYRRGTRSFALFINYQGAKYSLFF